MAFTPGLLSALSEEQRKRQQPQAMPQQQAAATDNSGALAIPEGWRLYDPNNAAEAYKVEDNRSSLQKVGNAVQDFGAGVLKIAPTAIKGVADLANMLTGDTVDWGVSKGLQRGMDAIDDVVGSEHLAKQKRAFGQMMQDENVGIGDILKFAADNKSMVGNELAATVGSMFLPAGAAGLAAKGAKAAKLAKGLGEQAAKQAAKKAAERASLATVAGQNAAETFSETQGDLSDRYLAAGVSGVISALAGKALGGGAEGMIARRLAGDTSRGLTSLAGNVAKEAGQESLEELGGILGEWAGTGERPNATNAGKQMAYAGLLGGLMGGGAHIGQHGIRPVVNDDTPQIDPNAGPISRAAAIAQQQSGQSPLALPAPGQLSGEAAMQMPDNSHDDGGNSPGVIEAMRRNMELQQAREQAGQERDAWFAQLEEANEAARRLTEQTRAAQEQQQAQAAQDALGAQIDGVEQMQSAQQAEDALARAFDSQAQHDAQRARFAPPEYERLDAQNGWEAGTAQRMYEYRNELAARGEENLTEAEAGVLAGLNEMFGTQAQAMQHAADTMPQQTALDARSAQHGEEAAAQSTAQAKTGRLDFGGRDLETLAGEYAAMEGTRGGRLIDVDRIRELSPEYRADRSRAADIHDEASAVSQQLFERALAKPVGNGVESEPMVVFTAGGGGSGKSSAIAQLLGQDNADVTLDGTLSNLDKARARVQAALDSGRDVQIRYVYRSPENAAASAIERALEPNGRPVPVNELAKAHANSLKTVRALAEEFKDNPKFEVVAIDNNGKMEDVHITDINQIPEVNYVAAKRAFVAAVDAAWAGSDFGRVRGASGEGAQNGQPDAGRNGVEESVHQHAGAAVRGGAERGNPQQGADAVTGQPRQLTAALYKAFTGREPPARAARGTHASAQNAQAVVSRETAFDAPQAGLSGAGATQDAQTAAQVAGQDAQNVGQITAPTGQDAPTTGQSAQNVGQSAPEVGQAPAPAAPTADLSEDARGMVEGGGAATRIITPDGRKLAAQWDVVEADSVQATLKEGVNQPRDRTRAASDAQVRAIARNPDFDRLSDTSQTMDYGAPTLTREGVIVAGNGRFEGVSGAYAGAPQAAAQYRAQLEENAQRFGLDAQRIRGMKKPVLVRRVTQDADTRQLAVQSNQPAGLRMSDMEQAALDAERMGANLADLHIHEDGSIAPTQHNHEVIARALGGYTTEEAGEFMAADGGLSQAGLRRVRNAILYRAYGKSDVLTRLLEAPDADMRNVGTALLRAAGSLAENRRAMDENHIPAEYDIAADLEAAIAALSRIRASGQHVESFLAQSDWVGGGLPESGRTILRMVSENLRSAKAITQFLREYAARVQSLQNAHGGLFGDMPRPGKQEVLEDVKRRIDEQRNLARGQNDLFGQSADSARGDGGTATADGQDAKPAGVAGDARGAGSSAQAGADRRGVSGQPQAGQDEGTDGGAVVAENATAEEMWADKSEAARVRTLRFGARLGNEMNGEQMRALARQPWEQIEPRLQRRIYAAMLLGLDPKQRGGLEFTATLDAVSNGRESPEMARAFDAAFWTQGTDASASSGADIKTQSNTEAHNNQGVTGETGENGGRESNTAKAEAQPAPSDWVGLTFAQAAEDWDGRGAAQRVKVLAGALRKNEMDLRTRMKTGRQSFAELDPALQRRVAAAMTLLRDKAERNGATVKQLMAQRAGKDLPQTPEARGKTEKQAREERKQDAAQGANLNQAEAVRKGNGQNLNQEAGEDAQASEKEVRIWNTVRAIVRRAIGRAAGLRGKQLDDLQRAGEWSNLDADLRAKLLQAWRANPDAGSEFDTPAAEVPNRTQPDADAAAILQGEPVAQLRAQDAPQGTFANVVAAVEKMFARFNYEKNRSDIGAVELDRLAVKKSQGHGKKDTIYKRAAFAAVPQVVERGALVMHARHSGVNSYYIAAPVMMKDTDTGANVESIVTVLVHHDDHVQRMYFHSITTKESLLRRGASGAADEESSRHSRTHVARGNASVAQGIYQGKVSVGQVRARLRELLTRGQQADDVALFSRAASGGDAAQDAQARELARAEGISEDEARARIEQAQREFAETERAYGGKAAYDVAKAAGRTKLNYRQWVQVRMPAFKAWFGDWEAKRARDALMDMDAVRVNVPQDWALLPARDWREAVKVEYGRAAKQGNVTMRDGREVRLSPVGFKETKQHSGISRDALNLLANIREVLEQAHHVASLPHEKAAVTDSVRAWHYYAAKVQMDGREMFARLVLREDVNGTIYYDNDLSSIEALEKETGSAPGDATPVNPEAAGTAADGNSTGGRGNHADQTKSGTPSAPADGHSLAELLSGGKTGEVSAVTDPETGEPLVLYHGTNSAGFTVFGRDDDFLANGTTKGAHWFSSSRRMAAAYTTKNLDTVEDARLGDAEHSGVYPVFLNIRDVVQDDFEGARWTGHHRGERAMIVLEDGTRITPEGRSFFDSAEEAEKYARAHNFSGYEIKNARLGRSTDTVAEDALKAGKDGAIIRNVRDGLHTPDTVFVVFDSAQVKSATHNLGLFGQRNPDIRFAREEAAGAPSRGRFALTAGGVRRVVRQALQGVGNAPRVEVVETVADLPFAAPSDAQGAFHNGRVWLVAENLKSAQEAREVLAHEMIGHYGLRGFFGRGLDMVLNRIHRNSVRVQRLSYEWRRDNADLIRTLEARGVSREAIRARSIEEALAQMAQAGEKLTGWKMLAGFVQNLLRKMGAHRWANMLEARTDAEALTALKQAEMFVRDGLTANDTIPNGALAAFERARTVKWADMSAEDVAAIPLQPVRLRLEGWKGSSRQLSALAREVYASELQGTGIDNASMGADVKFSAEGKGEAFGARDKLKYSVRAEVVRVLRQLVHDAVKVSEAMPDGRRERDSVAFHTLLAPLQVNGGEMFAARITVREARLVPEGETPHRFYDIALEPMRQTPIVHGFDDQGGSSRPASFRGREVTVSDLARAVNTQVTGGADTDAGAAFSFAGERGAAALDAAEEVTHRMDNLAVAREMEEAGRDAKAVKLATGWERGKDGKWRYELDDSGIDVNILTPSFSARDNPQVARYAALRDLMGRHALGVDGGRELTAEEQAEFARLKTAVGDVERTLGLQNAQRLEDGYSVYLHDVMDAPELFRAYPKLRSATVILEEMSGNGKLIFPDFAQPMIMLRKSLFHGIVTDSERAKTILLHEVQHAIQHMEGFAQGGDVELGRTQVEREHQEEREALVEKIRSYQYALDEETNPDKREHFQALIDTWKESLRVSDDAAFGAYRRFAGETEARNVQSRLGMTTEQRRAMLAEETEDVAREDQIVLRELMDKGAAAMSAGGREGGASDAKAHVREEVQQLLSDAEGAVIDGMVAKRSSNVMLPGASRIEFRELRRLRVPPPKGTYFEVAKDADGNLFVCLNAGLATRDNLVWYPAEGAAEMAQWIFEEPERVKQAGYQYLLHQILLERERELALSPEERAARKAAAEEKAAKAAAEKKAAAAENLAAGRLPDGTQGYIHDHDHRPYTPPTETLTEAQVRTVLEGANKVREMQHARSYDKKPLARIRSFSVFKKSKNIPEIAGGFVALAESLGWKASRSVEDIGSYTSSNSGKYLSISRPNPDFDADNIFSDEKITIDVRISDHARTTEMEDFYEENAINLVPSNVFTQSGFAYDTFESALWKLKNARVNERGSLFFGDEEAVYFSLAGREGEPAGNSDRLREDARRRFEERVEALRNDSTPQKAWQRFKDAGATKLSFEQWRAVRTQAFRDRFGDWEVGTAKGARMARTFADAREKAEDFKGKPLANMMTGMEAVVSRNRLDKMLNKKAVSKSVSPQMQAYAVANLDQLFARAVLGWSKPDRDNSRNIIAVHRFFAPLLAPDGKTAMLTKLTVHEDRNENQQNPLYTVEAVEFNEKSPAAQWVAASMKEEGHIRSAGDVLSLAQRVENFNASGMRAVLDPQTKEPVAGVVRRFLKAQKDGSQDDAPLFARGHSGQSGTLAEETEDVAREDQIVLQEMLGEVQESRSAQKSVTANIARGQAAMNRALLEKADQHRAMFRTGLGWVDFVWGDAKRGIQHMLNRRQSEDGTTREDVERFLIENVPDVIAKGEEVRRNTIGGSQRVVLGLNGDEVVLVKNPGANAWMVSGWPPKKKTPDAKAAANDTAKATHRAADSSDGAAGAGIADSIRPTNSSGQDVFGKKPSNTKGSGAMFARWKREKDAGRTALNYPAWLDAQKQDGSQDDAPLFARGGSAAAAAPSGGVPPSGNNGAPSQQAVNAFGNITAEQEAALRATGLLRSPKTLRQRFAELTDNLGKRLVQGLVDQYAPLKELDFRAYVLARMSKGTDGAFEALLHYGTPKVSGDTLEVDTSTGGLMQVLSELDGEQDRFLAWIAANRAEKLSQEGREFLFTPEQIQHLKALNQGTMKDGTSRAMRYAATLQKFNDFQDAVLAIAEARGLIDAESRAVWQNGFYVPFYRNMEDGTTGASVRSGLVNQYAFKKLKGSRRQLNEDLLANTLQNMAHLLSAAAKNQAASAALRAADSAGVAHRVPSGTKGSVRFLDNGREVHYLVDDPFVFDAITSLESVKVAGLEKVLSKFKHMLTFGVTINPTFQLRSLIRDALQSMAITNIGMNPLANVKQGIASQLNKDQDYINALASGGLIRFNSLLEGNRADYTRRLIRKGVKDSTILDTPEKIRNFFGTAVDKWLAVGDISESTNRMALYKQLVAQGVDPLLAAYQARDLMDFSMQGQWRAVRFLTQVVPFLNARMQGLYKLGRDGVMPTARVLFGQGSATDKQIARRFGAVTGAVALASIALMAAYEDDDDWKRREDWDRDTYWWFKLGGTAYRIPKPFEVGAIGTVAERTAELLMSDEMTGRRFLSRMGHMASDTFSLNPIPQAVKPLLDVYANKDSFTGRPIESMGMERLRPEDRYTGSTSEFSKWLGQLGLPDPARLVSGEYSALSPVQIDALIRGYFSWIGVSASRMVDEGVRAVAERPARPAMQLRDVFFAGNFVESLPSNTSRYVTALYEQAKEVETAYASYRFALRQGDLTRARELLARDGDKIRMKPQVTKAKSLVAKLSENIRAVERDPHLSAAEKRLRIDRIKSLQHQAAMRAARL